MEIPRVLIIIGGFAVIGTFVANVIVGAIVRLRQANAPRSPQLADLDARLARIEASVQSLAMEVEHANEMQRLQNRAPDVPRQLERRDPMTFNTPH